MKIYFYLIGALLGGVAGYFILYRLIGCATGTCPISANPYIATGYGIVIGALIVGVILPSGKKKTKSKNADN